MPHIWKKLNSEVFLKYGFIGAEKSVLEYGSYKPGASPRGLGLGALAQH